MYIKVRAEEVVIGGLLGWGVGAAIAAAFVHGLPTLFPSLHGSTADVLRAGLVWAVAGGCALYGGWMAARQEQDSHVNGVRYVADFKVARRALQQIETRQFSETQRAGKVHGVKIGGVELSRERETGGFYIAGVTGAGKTAILNSIIEPVLARGDRLFLHDPKGDLTARYWKGDGSVVILGPWDARAAVWDAAADMPDPADANQFAAAACGATAAAGQNKSFHDNAATVLAGLIKSHMVGGSAWSWRDLRAAFAAGPKAMIEQAARGDDAARTAMPSVFVGGEMTSGERAVLSVLTSASRWLTAYAAVDAAETDRPRFSLRKWLTGEAHANVRIVIINSNARYSEACEGIFGAMLSIVASMAASAALPEVSADAPNGLWVVVDESPQLGAPALMAIQKITELGRSRGVRVITAMQDESQLEGVVGREKAAPMLSVQGSRIYLHASDKLADAVSRRMGEREIQRIETTAQSGAVAGKVKRATTQRVIQPSDLLGLHVRRNEPPTGVELILQTEDVLGRLVQPFPRLVPDSEQAPKLIESEAWRMGTLPGWGAGGAAGATNPAGPEEPQGPSSSGRRTAAVFESNDSESNHLDDEENDEGGMKWE